MSVYSALPGVVLVSEGSTQPCIPLWTFKSYPGLFLAEHTTLYSFARLRQVITILHFEPVGRRVWSSLWGGFRSKHPSTPCKPVD